MRTRNRRENCIKPDLKLRTNSDSASEGRIGGMEHIPLYQLVGIACGVAGTLMMATATVFLILAALGKV